MDWRTVLEECRQLSIEEQILRVDEIDEALDAMIEEHLPAVLFREYINGLLLTPHLISLFIERLGRD